MALSSAVTAIGLPVTVGISITPSIALFGSISAMIFSISIISTFLSSNLIIPTTVESELFNSFKVSGASI